MTSLRNTKEPGAEDTLALANLAPGKVGMIQHLDGGRGLVGRLSTLGFTPGAQVTMVENFGRGPLIVMVRGTRIALGQGEAQKITVVPVRG